jgi:hypothetical protein
MVAQEHIAISDPSLSPLSAELIRVVDKQQKKEKEELAKLQTVLRLVEKEVSDTKTRASSESAGPSNTKFSESMAQMILALQMLQVLIAKYGNEKSLQHKEMSDAQVELAKDTLKDVEKQLEKMSSKMKGEKVAHTVEEAAEIALGAVTIIVGAALAQPELVVMGVLSLAAAAGAFREATKYTAMALEGLGWVKNKQEAEIIASVVVCAAVVTCSLMGADPEAAVEETAEAATEVTDSAINSADMLSVIRRGGEQLIEGVKGLPSPVRVGVMAFFTALPSTDIVQSSCDLIAERTGMSEKEKKKMEEIMQYVLLGLCLAVSTTMALGAASATESTANDALSVRQAKMLRDGFKIATLAGVAGSAGGQAAEGWIQIKEGMLQYNLMKDQAALALLETLMSMNAEETRASQQHEADAERSTEVNDSSAKLLVAGDGAFANVGSPV